LPYFQAQLSPYGSWMDLPPYGQVWHPGAAINDPNWRPYCQGGHWVMTDAGWYWQADDPWGAMVFHYGRWTLDPNAGWIWVPGYNWAPSWVAWRRTDGFYGWAPLPPRAEFVAGVGISIGGGVAVGASFDFGLGAGAFTFVGFGNMWAHDYGAIMLAPARVNIVFGASVIQNSYAVVGGRFVVEGFGRHDVEVRTGHAVEVVSINKQVTIEHTTVVRNITNVRNVSIRNSVTTVRNVTNVRNVNNTRNVTDVKNVNNTRNVNDTRNVNNTRNANESKTVNNRETPAGRPGSAEREEPGAHKPPAPAAHPATPGAQRPGTERPGAEKPGAPKKPLPAKGEEKGKPAPKEGEQKPQ
jgi:hypothetical protein